MMTETVLEIVAKDAVRMEWVMSYLNVVAKNPLLSPMNQALVYFQKPNSGVVCGRSAWVAMGREIRADAAPITVYLPEVKWTEEGWRAEYGVVNVFEEGMTELSGSGAEMAMGGSEDPSSLRSLGMTRRSAFGMTEGMALGMTGKRTVTSLGMTGEDIVGRILEVTGSTTEMIEEEVLSDRFVHGMYDWERNVFFLEKGSSGELQERTVAELFVEKMAHDLEIKDKVMVLAAKYAVQKRYGLEPEIGMALFSKLDRYETGQKVGFVTGVGRLVEEAVQAIEGRCLSFSETAFVNGMFTTDDKSELTLRCMQAAETAEDEMLSEELRRFGELLLYMDEESIKRLYWMRAERRLFSYPGVKIPRRCAPSG